jgi:exodeoxyribonuclease V alpha subunit
MATMTTQSTISSSRFADIIAKARLAKAIQIAIADDEAQEKLRLESTIESTVELVVTLDQIRDIDNMSVTDKYGKEITYNDKQQEFISLATSHKSCILIGPAGTGKTTAMKGTVSSLIQSSGTGILQNHDHKHLPHGVPGIVICAYTRRATNNIRRNMSEDMKANCVTIHKLLEYQPEYTEIITESGESKTTMRFAPGRNPGNPLPSEITTIIFEESSMIGTALYQEVIDSLPNKNVVQIIFLGDIQQLPPVFGSAILGFKMLELPLVELTEVYRQALESPIIRLAHRILSGAPIPPAELTTWNCPGLTIKPWKKKIDAEAALSVSEKLFDTLYEKGAYDPENDIILIPFNKAYGTIELNKSIANHLARKKQSVTWEVVSGFIKHYFSSGDKVLYDREDAIILDIYPNPSYTGVPAQKESTYLDYWGHNNSPKGLSDSNVSDSESDIDFLLAQVAADDADRVTQSSHCIKLLMQDSGTEKTVTKAAEINALILGYCLTVHKSQGSEWDKVFLLFHNSHATMMQRELLYTAVTRAKKELFVICESDTFTSAVKSQRIKGNTLAEKAIYFQGKVDRMEQQS